MILNVLPKMALSQYDFLSEIGKGSYGHVYLVEHKLTKKRYACKKIILDHDYHLNYDVLNELMFYNLVKKNHLFLQCRSVIMTQKEIYLIIDLIENTFFQAVDYPIKKRLDLFPQIFGDMVFSLAAIHYLGFTHNDLHYNNLFLNKNGRAYIGDYGIMMANGCSTTPSYNTLSITFNRNYHPPDIVKTKEEKKSYLYTKKHEIYILGVLLLSFLAGQKQPFAYSRVKDAKFNAYKLLKPYFTPQQLNAAKIPIEDLNAMISADPDERNEFFVTSIYPEIKKFTFFKSFVYYPLEKKEFDYMYQTFGNHENLWPFVVFFEIASRFSPDWRKEPFFLEAILILVYTLFNYITTYPERMPRTFPVRLAIQIDFFLRTCQQEKIYFSLQPTSAQDLYEKLQTLDYQKINHLDFDNQES